MKAFDEKIIEDMQEENKLASAYQALIASADVEFDGQHLFPGRPGSQNERREPRRAQSGDQGVLGLV